MFCVVKFMFLKFLLIILIKCFDSKKLCFYWIVKYIYNKILI